METLCKRKVAAVDLLRIFATEILLHLYRYLSFFQADSSNYVIWVGQYRTEPFQKLRQCRSFISHTSPHYLAIHTQTQGRLSPQLLQQIPLTSDLHPSPFSPSLSPFPYPSPPIPSPFLSPFHLSFPFSFPFPFPKSTMGLGSTVSCPSEV